ncbi:putative rIIB [Erwinia phage Fifi067]|nr:putative rIIB [Erwinia phage Fifi067]
MNKVFITIVALSIDTQYATLYKEDGSTVMIKQGDPRLPNIVATAKGPLSRNEPVEVDITEIFAQRTEYAEAEKGTGGLVKFFRVAKKFVEKLVNTESPTAVAPEAEHITPLSLGIVPGSNVSPFAAVKVEDTIATAVGTKWKVWITGYPLGVNRVQLIKALRACTDSGLKEAKDMSEQPLPYLLSDDLTELQATVRRSLLEEVDGLKFKVLTMNEADPLKDESDTVPAPELEPEKKAEPLPQTNAEKVSAAQAKMDLLVGNGAVSTEQEAFHKPLDEKEETIVAVNTQTGAVIPDAQKLAPHLKAASELKDYVGFKAFFERLSAVVDKRGHSVEDLMKFLHQADLPLADDGCIIGFKRLDGKNGAFVDCHTKKVLQKVGSFVFMRHGLVDPNRRQDCSNGLHIAAKSYLRSFSGSVMVMVKINPEDVFAVPQYSHNKMRVAGYHIVAELPKDLAALITSGGNLSDKPLGAKVLNNVMRGNHIGITQTVEIGGQQGSNLTILEQQTEFTNPRMVFDETEITNKVIPVGADILPEDLEQPKAAPVVATDVKPVDQEEMSQKEFVRNHFVSLSKLTPNDAHKVAVELMALKTRTGKSWHGLGLTDEQASQIHTYIQTAEDKQAPKATVAKPKKAKAKAKAKSAKAPKANKPAVASRPAGSSPRTIIRAAIDNGIAQNVEQILLAKKQAKKGWAALGVTEAEQAEIEKHSK